MKIKKTLLTFVSVCLAAFLLSNIVTYAVSKKNLLDYFFGESNRNVTVEKEMLNKESQKIVVDDYTITLEEALCEKETQLGYLVFSVKKNDGKVEADISKNGVLNSFGNNRFIFDYEETGSFKQIAKYDGNVLDVYISFEANDKIFEQSKLSKCVGITDLKEKRNNEYKRYSFDLKYSEKCKKYKTNEGTLFISPLGCKFISSIKNDDVNIKIKMVDNELNISDFSEAGTKTDNVEEVHYTNMFDELIDISEIQEVMLDNKKLIEIDSLHFN